MRRALGPAQPTASARSPRRSSSDNHDITEPGSPRIAAASSFFFACSSSTFPSTVPRVISRWAKTVGLADPVGPVDGLGLGGGVPPGVQQEPRLGGGEVQAGPAGLQADEHQLAVRVALEAVDLGLRLRLAVQVGVGGAGGVQWGADVVEQADELGDDGGLAGPGSSSTWASRSCSTSSFAPRSFAFFGAARTGRQAAWRSRSRASRTWISRVPSGPSRFSPGAGPPPEAAASFL